MIRLAPAPSTTVPTTLAHLTTVAEEFGLDVIVAGEWRYVVRVVPGLGDGGPGVLVYEAHGVTS